MLKLLIVKTSSLGDVIHNLPIIHDIRTQYPNAEIDWVVEESFADIPKLHPGVNRVIPVALRRWRKAIFNQNTWAEIKAAKRSISQHSYDVILDTQGLIKSGLITAMSHGHKHGFDKNSAREPLASHFYNTSHPVTRNQHAVARIRTLAALTFDYSIPTDLPNYGIAASAQADINLTSPYVVGLHGTSRDSKLWPVAHWIQLGTELAKLNLQLVLPWASAAEHQRAQQIAGALHNAHVLPKQRIAQLATIISQAQAAVGVDTGLSHLSVALSIPTVAIYTDTNPALTGVYAGAHAPAINLGNINQTPTHAQVIDALKNIL
ncbi:lipopolysaccharide heptosyltransferase I [Methylotenera mobilis]|uniref:Lipopolysaccharide heptosyltransferase 1 n=1 Tax=Methylotenera mobilis (strain JLW8 / ATCC BAA-1282 / DSM 17540) TaxID=583345 RepID=C6WXJ1_METML|nr:lipopolysaccharide heptosyltransferase I [Methylotenera mobilis]ACT48640.1 lipopolysaccharide heptosyltransferase I [Methylotenera mobilis JLW8]